MTLSFNTLLPIFKSTQHLPIDTKVSPPTLLIFLLHLKTLGLLTIDLTNFEDIMLMPAPVSNSVTTGILFACTLYRIGLESSVLALLIWISFTSFHSHSESDSSKAWHNSLISSSVICACEFGSFSFVKEGFANAYALVIHKPTELTYHPFLDIFMFFLVPVSLFLIFLTLGDVMWAFTVVTFQSSHIFVVFVVIIFVRLVLMLSVHLLFFFQEKHRCLL